MSTIVERYNKIKSNLVLLKPVNPVNIIAVSKTFPLDHIKPILDAGHTHFGENKVQEAIAKWSSLKSQMKSLKLHMIGKLQSNKAKEAVKLFDYIHSLDNQKLALKISEYEKNSTKKIKLFIQVNVGEESQKSGINIESLPNFFNECKKLDLNIIGTMCLPPIDKDPEIFFSNMLKINNDLKLKELSMGMSEDYLKAIKYYSTYLRVGSKIFGPRS